MATVQIFVATQVPRVRGRARPDRVLQPGGYSMPSDLWARMVLALGPEIIEAAIADGTITVEAIDEPADAKTDDKPAARGRGKKEE